MANVGTLLVELGVNIGAYLDGMSKATYSAKQTAKEISSSFSEMGSVLGGVFSQFGVLGGLMDSMLSKAGALGGSLSKVFAGFGGEAALAAGAGGAVAAAIVVAGAAALGFAAHGAEAAAKLHELSEITGVSTETLSRYGYAARQNGVDSDVMVKGLERLSKSAFTAATAPQGAINAYTRMGVTVKDSNNQMLPLEQILGQVSDKFAKMADGPAKTALAIQLFSKGGAAMIPMLNQGSAAMAKYAAEADAFGVTVSGSTAAAAHVFEQSMDKIGEAGTGIQNQLMKQLLPAMQTVADQMVSALKDPDSGLRSMITTVGYVSEAILALGELIVQMFKQDYNVIYGTISTLQEAGITLKNEAKAAMHLDWSGFVEAGQAGGRQLAKVWSGTLDDMKSDGFAFVTTIQKIFSESSATAIAPEGPKKSSPAAVSGPASGQNAINKRIAALKGEAEASEANAGATNQSAAALILETADKEAANEITSLYAQTLDKTGKPIAALTALVKANAGSIKEWSEIKAASGASDAFLKSVIEETDKLQQETKGIQALLAAQAKGSGAGQMDAAGQQALAKQAATLQTQVDLYNSLAAAYGKTNPLVADQKLKVDADTKAFNDLSAALKANNQAKISEDVAKTTKSVSEQAQAQAILSQAIFKTAAAQREANAAADVVKFQQSHPGASSNDLGQVYKDAMAQQQASYNLQIEQAAEQDDLNKKYDDELTKLTAVRDLLQKNGVSTLQVDAQIKDAQEQMNAQWDQAALKVGTFHDKVTAVFNEIQQQGLNMGQTIADSFVKATDSMESELSKVLVTGKGSKGGMLAIGQNLGESITQSVMKSGLSKVSGSLMGMLGIKTPGSEGKLGANSGNPMYVTVVDASGNILGALGGLGGSSGGGSLFGDLGLSGSNPFGSLLGAGPAAPTGAGGGLLSGLGGGIGGLLSKALSFIPGLAGGGDVTPGKAYIVGEHQPELFLPGQSGRIVPNFASAPKQSQTSIAMHIYGVSDADSFKKSQTQITGMMGAAAQRAQARLNRS